MWTNIIDNAVDAMGGHGELKLRTCVEDGKVVVEITDSGPGIPPQIRSRIFDPFFTTKGPGFGSGLGLHISRNIVVLKHKGQIDVDLQPGKTTFRVVLPVQKRRLPLMTTGPTVHTFSFPDRVTAYAC